MGPRHRVDRLVMGLRVTTHVHVVADEDHAPHEDEQHGGDRRHQGEGPHHGVFRGKNEGRTNEDDGAHQAPTGDAIAGEFAEGPRRHALVGQSVEHPRGRIDPGVGAGCGRRENDEVHDAGSRGETDESEHLDERRGVLLDEIPRDDTHHGEQGNHIEHQDAHGDGIDGLGHGLAGITGFRGGSTDQLDAHVSENSNLEAAEESAPALRRESAMGPQVRH